MWVKRERRDGLLGPSQAGSVDCQTVAAVTQMRPEGDVRVRFVVITIHIERDCRAGDIEGSLLPA